MLRDALQQCRRDALGSSRTISKAVQRPQHGRNLLLHRGLIGNNRHDRNGRSEQSLQVGLRGIVGTKKHRCRCVLLVGTKRLRADVPGDLLPKPQTERQHGLRYETFKVGNLFLGGSTQDCQFV